jgi:hypothetical protein
MANSLALECLDKQLAGQHVPLRASAAARDCCMLFVMDGSFSIGASSSSCKFRDTRVWGG